MRVWKYGEELPAELERSEQRLKRIAEARRELEKRPRNGGGIE